MHLIVGLGNPGKNYENTRHNVGFFMIDALRVHWNFPEWKVSKHKGEISEGTLGGRKVILLKPNTYMNLSGESVASLTLFYKIPLTSLLILSDDIDMDFAKIRYRASGSHGGQNGLRDIIEKLGSSDFSRIKIGIGRDERYSVSDWVLSRFLTPELFHLEKETFPEVLTKIENWIS